MMNKMKAENIARDFYGAIDCRYWNKFESIMVDKVNIAMKSPEREKKGVMTKQAISTMWQDQFAMVYDRTCNVLKNLEAAITVAQVYVKSDIDYIHFFGVETSTDLGSHIFIIKIVYV